MFRASVFYMLILFALLARIVFLLHYDYLYDDAYIIFRYAENLSQGFGFVYNQGESVYGSSPPLYTFLLAAVGLVFSRDWLPHLAQWIGCLSLFGSALLLWKYLPFTLPGKMIIAVGLLSYPRIFFAS